MPQSDINIFYSVYRWWNVHKLCILQIVKIGVAKLVSNVFLVAIFDATFADQMLESNKCVLISTIFWISNVWAFKKK